MNRNYDHFNAREQNQCYRCKRAPRLYAQETAAGVKGVYFCDYCRAHAFGGSSFTRLSDEQRASLPRLEANKEACWVCGVVAVLEVHHLAPQAQFGDDSDNWPLVKVCDACHRRWEDRMGTHPWRAAK